ncbi:hypothetical protein UA75_20715 [Actinoalloteichus sp. GBA129-24]|uniref:Uncharacterized protein n=1 Tax=Actinoalloteichus fjordicus TaxID=1612552 RepID=A0AAC9LFZ3_9PSEU|nr:hypothetical protein UA74_20210 [Actinoalloteichus fjordicus]APU22132.1 hypothetical protein UA75_20715 [Actinoalloteichus sp. GBA129-24]
MSLKSLIIDLPTPTAVLVAVWATTPDSRREKSASGRSPVRLHIATVTGCGENKQHAAAFDRTRALGHHRQTQGGGVV